MIRVVIAVFLLVVSVFGIPTNHAPSPQGGGDGVGGIVSEFSPVDQALWAELWEKCGKTISGDVGAAEPLITDTRALRLFTVLACDIAWRRIGGNRPSKYVGLREAVEKHMSSVLGADDVPVTDEIRKAYAEACYSLAYAGRNRG